MSMKKLITLLILLIAVAACSDIFTSTQDKQPDLLTRAVYVSARFGHAYALAGKTEQEMLLELKATMEDSNKTEESKQ